MQIDFSLKGKTILVTGASSTIGRGIAQACSASGAKVILLARNLERLKESASMCSNVLELCTRDLSKELDSLPQLVQELTMRHGSLDGLVHAAGILEIVPLRVLRAESCVESVRVNALAGLMLIKGIALFKPPEHCVSAVIISSIMGRVGQIGQIAYCMSKGAVENMVRAAALELSAGNIRVNAIAPSMIESDMLTSYKELVTSATWDAMIKLHPMGIGSTADVSAAVIYLLSDAAKYITGTSLLVDGGYCAQ